MSRYVAEFKFEWDDGNRKHIARHGVTPEEAEEVITSHPLVLEVQFRNGERRILCAGRTRKGRVVVVVYTTRRGRLRVVTAFPAKRSLRERL
jgi:uncharacterized DUF497 family protein